MRKPFVLPKPSCSLAALLEKYPVVPSEAQQARLEELAVLFEAFPELQQLAVVYWKEVCDEEARWKMYINGYDANGCRDPYGLASEPVDGAGTTAVTVETVLDGMHDAMKEAFRLPCALRIWRENTEILWEFVWK